MRLFVYMYFRRTFTWQRLGVKQNVCKVVHLYTNLKKKNHTVNLKNEPFYLDTRYLKKQKKTLTVDNKQNSNTSNLKVNV